MQLYNCSTIEKFSLLLKIGKGKIYTHFKAYFNDRKKAKSAVYLDNEKVGGGE